MTTINKQQLKNLNTCEDRFNRFIAATDNTNTDVNVLDLIGSDVTTSDLLWLADKILPKKMIAQFAIDCAESVVHLSINKELAQNCIDTAKSVIENGSVSNRVAGANADYAARVAGARVAAAPNGLAEYRANSAYAAAAYATAPYATAAYRAASAADSKFDVKPLLVKLFN